MDELLSTSDSTYTAIDSTITQTGDNFDVDSSENTNVKSDSDSDSLSGKSSKADDYDESFSSGSGNNLFEELNKKQSSATSTPTSSLFGGSDNSLFSSTENSNSCTRRHSITSTIPDLGTPLNFLFRSPTSTVSIGSNTETPVTRVSAEEDIVSGLDRLLHRITSERFLELRRIQLGERPVTGGEARTSIENFFQRALHGPTEEQRTAEEEANRPENVASDVQSLLQLSRVRSALQSGFSTRLESTLSFRAQPSMLQQATQRPRSNNNTRHNIQQRQNNVVRQQIRQPLPISRTGVPHPPPPPPINREMGGYSIPFNPPTEEEMVRRNTPTTTNRPSALQSTVDASVEMLAESIATDITRLQSLQVVSSMLRTDFRTELENLVQQRVERSGNGAAVAEIIRSLPRTQRPAQNQQQASTRSHVMDNNRRVSDEVYELRHQLEEMKRMMAMSLEMQMDTQRAIRQEVAAVFTAFMQDYLKPQGSSATASLPQQQSTASYTSPSTPARAGQCVICIDRSVDTVLYQCGHMCTCHQCGLQLKMEGHKCPMCRAPIRDIIRAYKSQEPTNQ